MNSLLDEIVSAENEHYLRLRARQQREEEE